MSSDADDADPALFLCFCKDYEIAVFEPFLEMLPSRPKNFFQRYGSLVYAHLIYCVMMPQDCLKRIHLWYVGKTKPRPENFIILLELLTYIYFAPSVWVSSTKRLLET